MGGAYPARFLSRLRRLSESDTLPQRMRHLAIAFLVGLPLIAAASFAQNSPPPETLPPASSADPATDAQAPPSSALAEAAASSVLKVCDPKNAPPCATVPRVIKSPDPRYSKEARKKKVEGTVVLWVVIETDGHPRTILVTRSVGYGLDEEAVKAVRKWRFNPSTFNDKPVAVQINVEVSFKLY